MLPRETLARRKGMKPIAVVGALLALVGYGQAQSGALPIVSARGGVVVLARVVEVRDGPPGEAWNQVSERGREILNWKHLVLERVDTFVGSAPPKMVVAYAASQVEFANRIAQPTRSGGGSGPPPQAGLQVGDVSIWTLQRPNGDGRYLNNGWWLTPPNRSEEGDVFTAPGSQFAAAGYDMPPVLAAGQTLSVAPKVELPEYDRKLSGPLRYADLIAGTALQRYGAERATLIFNSLQRLETLPSRFEAPQGLPELVSRKALDEWFASRVAARWPKGDEARLNLLAMELKWGMAQAEPEFLSLLKGVGRRSLLVFRPPVKSESYYVELCEDPTPGVATEGFEHMRKVKSHDPRVLRAALKWLDLAGGAKDDERSRDARSTGLFAQVVWYVADTADDRSFAVAEDYRGHKPEQYAAARRTVERLLKESTAGRK